MLMDRNDNTQESTMPGKCTVIDTCSTHGPYTLALIRDQWGTDVRWVVEYANTDTGDKTHHGHKTRKAALAEYAIAKTRGGL